MVATTHSHQGIKGQDLSAGDRDPASIFRASTPAHRMQTSHGAEVLFESPHVIPFRGSCG